MVDATSSKHLGMTLVRLDDIFNEHSEQLLKEIRDSHRCDHFIRDGIDFFMQGHRLGGLELKPETICDIHSDVLRGEQKAKYIRYAVSFLGYEEILLSNTFTAAKPVSRPAFCVDFDKHNIVFEVNLDQEEKEIEKDILSKIEEISKYINYLNSQIKKHNRHLKKMIPEELEKRNKELKKKKRVFDRVKDFYAK